MVKGRDNQESQIKVVDGVKSEDSELHPLGERE